MKSACANFLSRLARITARTGAALVYPHHQSKGDQSDKDMIDRFSGKNDLARDAATIVTLTARDGQDEYFDMCCRTNNFEQPPDRVTRKQYPLFVPATKREMEHLEEKRGAKTDDPIKLLHLIPNPAEGGGPQYILHVNLLHDTNEKWGWSDKRSVAALNYLKEKSRIEMISLPTEKGVTGRKPRGYIRR
jgi:hypothetical protein